jgi:hypothetical protein
MDTTLAFYQNKVNILKNLHKFLVRLAYDYNDLTFKEVA